MSELPGLVRHKRLALALLSIGCSIALLIWFYTTNQQTPTLDESTNLLNPESDILLLDTTPPPSSTEHTTNAPYVIVYISGGVARPDVYRLPADARIKDVVLAAGGFAEDADTDHINLADHITDAQHIDIPRQGATDNPAKTDKRPPQTPSLLDINTASTTELEALDGIGAALAQRIVEYRTEQGPFQKIEDLRNIKGISSKLFDTIAPLITVGS